MARATHYIFVFLGEFGFELLNWQGVIRRFASTISPEDEIVCCSRGDVRSLYETAGVYIDISDVDLFRRSQASGYSACKVGAGKQGPLAPTYSLRGLAHERRLRASLKRHIADALRKSDSRKELKRVFVFSSTPTRLNGCDFGSARYRRGLAVAAASLRRHLTRLHPAFGELEAGIRRAIWARVPALAKERSRGTVYGQLDVDNNAFSRIAPDLSYTDLVESKLGW